MGFIVYIRNAEILVDAIEVRSWNIQAIFETIRQFPQLTLFPSWHRIY